MTDDQLDLLDEVLYASNEKDLQKIAESLFQNYENKDFTQKFQSYDLSIAYMMCLLSLENNCPKWKFDFCQQKYLEYRNLTIQYLRGHIK